MKNTKQYAGVVTRVCTNEEDGDYMVTFLVKLGTGNCYIINEKDVSLIDFAQVDAVLPQPQIVKKGSKRFAYEFPCSLVGYLR